jgi:DNA-binding Lrp family transcriptional regulator
MVGLDPLDQRIFEQLSGNGRMSNLEVARQVGVSEKTVRQRIRRLIERDGMRVVAVMQQAPAPSQLIVLVHAETGQRFSVAERLAGQPCVDQVHLTTGAFELIAEASFGSDAEAIEWYVHNVESGPGVRSAQSTHIIETIAQSREPRLDHFGGFDSMAEELDDVRDLFDLACDVAKLSLGTHRIVVGNTTRDPSDATAPLFGSGLRWRGLSARYIDALGGVRRSESVIIPNVIERGQHVFVADAQTDPLFGAIADLVVSEGFHSFLAVPVRSDNATHGTMNLYYDSIIPYSEHLVAQAQELADLIGKHLSRRTQQAAPA